jgi:hypothetical protein
VLPGEGDSQNSRTVLPGALIPAPAWGFFEGSVMAGVAPGLAPPEGCPTLNPLSEGGCGSSGLRGGC